MRALLTIVLIFCFVAIAMLSHRKGFSRAATIAAAAAIGAALYLQIGGR